MSQENGIAAFVYPSLQRIDLQPVLRNVKTFASQVFVVDASRDLETIEMARAFNVKVLHPPLESEAAQFKWVLDTVAISSGWIMLLRAGERVDANLITCMCERLASMPRDIAGVYLNRKVIFQERQIRWGGEFPEWVLRLWRTGKVIVEDRWGGEYVKLDGERSTRFPITSSVSVRWNVDSLAEITNFSASWEALRRLKVRLNQHDVEDNWLRRTLAYHVPPVLLASAAFFYRYIILLGFLDRRAGFTYFMINAFIYRLLIGVHLKHFQSFVGKGTDKCEASGRLQELAERIAELKWESNDTSASYRDLLR